MKSFLLFLLLPIYAIKLSIIKTGIISLPQGIQLFKLHHMVLLENEKDKIVVDLVPEKKNKYNALDLVLGKSIPAKIRIRRIPENISKEKLYSFLCSSRGKSITNEEVNSLTLKIFLFRIKNWYDLKKNNYTMNIYKRNCHHYCDFVKKNHKIYCGKYR